MKGGRTSPSVRPQTQNRASIKHSPSTDRRTVEALGVLIQHLVFNVSETKKNGFNINSSIFVLDGSISSAVS